MSNLSKQNITAWFFEGGSISIPRRLLGLMEPLGLSFEDFGKILYLLYCGPDQIKRSDRYAMEAAQTLHSKGLIHWFTDTETVDFSPMFDRISASLGEQSQYLACDTSDYSTAEFNYAQLIKKLEQTLGLFLTLRDKEVIQEVVQRYNWSYELVYEIYKRYYQKHRKQYDFRFFCQMAYGANVRDKASFLQFASGLDTIYYKVTEVLRMLGQRCNPSEPQKELYIKWTGKWRFSHEMVLLAVNETVSAQNPSFAYIDSVLQDWRKRGVTDPEILAEEKARREQARATLGKKSKLAVIQNFPSKPRDLSGLEK